MDAKALLTIIGSLIAALLTGSLLVAKGKGYLDELRSLVERLCIPLAEDRIAHWDEKSKQCSTLVHLVPANTKVLTGLAILPGPSDDKVRLADELEKLAVSLFPSRVALVGGACLAVGLAISVLVAILLADFVEPTLKVLGDKTLLAILLGATLVFVITSLMGTFALFLLLPQVNGNHVKRISEKATVWDHSVAGVPLIDRPLRDAKSDSSYQALNKS